MDFDTVYEASTPPISLKWRISLLGKKMRRAHMKNSTETTTFYVKYKIFGKIGIVPVFDKKIKAKLDNRGI